MDDLTEVTKECILELANSSSLIWEDFGIACRPGINSTVQGRESFIRDKYIHKKYMTAIESPHDALVTAIYGNNLVMASKALRFIDTNGSLLHKAAEVGHLLIVELLILNGVDLEERNTEGVTPLDVALVASQMEVVSHLVNILDNRR